MASEKATEGRNRNPERRDLYGEPQGRNGGRKRHARELVFTNGTILTMEWPEATAEAVLVVGSRVQAVGSAVAVAAQTTDEAELIDLEGRALMPGFNDAHIDAGFFGAQLSGADLAGRNGDEIIATLRNRYWSDGSAPHRGETLWGYHWDYEWCPEPDRAILDVAFPDNPVALQHCSGHKLWVNSAMLCKLGLDESTPNWDTGGLERDQSGRLTGVITEPAHNPRIQRYWLRETMRRKTIRERLEAALPLLARYGITSVQDDTWFPPAVSELARLYRRGELTCRFSCWSFGLMRPIERWFGAKRFRPGWYARGARKFFLDGDLTSRTAWLTEPCADPLVAVKAAATRPGEERISIAEALYACTAGSAYAEHAEQHKGKIAPGYCADLIVLSGDPNSVDPHRLDELSVELTMVDGRVVYDQATLKRRPLHTAASGRPGTPVDTPAAMTGWDANGTDCYISPGTPSALAAYARESWFPLMGGHYWR